MYAPIPLKGLWFEGDGTIFVLDVVCLLVMASFLTYIIPPNYLYLVFRLHTHSSACVRAYPTDGIVVEGVGTFSMVDRFCISITFIVFVRF